MQHFFLILIGEIIAVAVIAIFLRKTLRDKREALAALDQQIIDMLPRLLYPKGTVMMCEKSHIIGTAKCDIYSDKPILREHFDFMAGQEPSSGDATVCKICHSDVIERDEKGNRRLVKAIVPKN